MRSNLLNNFTCIFCQLQEHCRNTVVFLYNFLENFTKIFKKKHRCFSFKISVKRMYKVSCMYKVPRRFDNRTAVVWRRTPNFIHTPLLKKYMSIVIWDKGVRIKFGVLRHTTAGQLPTRTRNFRQTANFRHFWIPKFSDFIKDLYRRKNFAASRQNRDYYLVNDIVCANDEKITRSR